MHGEYHALLTTAEALNWVHEMGTGYFTQASVSARPSMFRESGVHICCTSI
jgi:hypothetical protein